MIEDVPVSVCHRCGESYFDGPMMIKIEEMLEREAVADMEITIPVFECPKCGKEYYDGKVMLDIERMLDSKDNIERVISVPVMKYKVAKKLKSIFRAV